MDNFDVHKNWEIDISAGFLGTGTENYGKTDICTGIVWIGTRNYDIHENHMGGNGERDVRISSRTIWAGMSNPYFCGIA